MTEQLESWESAEYVAQWAGDDVVGNMLELPRRISAALVADSGIPVARVVDLGSGPGAYLELFLRRFPDARGTWIDASEAMHELAQETLSAFGDRLEYVIADVERPDELSLESADVVVTSRVLHHFSPDALRRLYATLHDILMPGGFLFNLDHVGAAPGWEQRYRRIRAQFTGPRKRPLKPHRHDYPFLPVEDHLELLRAAGFEAPDTPWRAFYTALLAGQKHA